ncbi:hypothetical protein LINPERHAP2_LOCUS19394 [Linum perenne]
MDSTAAITIFETNWEVHLRHTYREANKAVDHLANRGHSLPPRDYSVPASDLELGFFSSV